MDKIVKNIDINSLKKSDLPLIIYSLTEEAEAIANSFKDKDIKVLAFCDNEVRKSKKNTVILK